MGDGRRKVGVLVVFGCLLVSRNNDVATVLLVVESVLPGRKHISGAAAGSISQYRVVIIVRRRWRKDAEYDVYEDV
jgi:hypothetical protein